MADNRGKCLVCNGSGVDYGETCLTCGGQGKTPFREWGREDDDERLLASHAQQTIDQIKVYILHPESGFKTSPELRNTIYDKLVDILYPDSKQLRG